MGWARRALCSQQTAKESHGPGRGSHVRFRDGAQNEESDWQRRVRSAHAFVFHAYVAFFFFKKNHQKVSCVANSMNAVPLSGPRSRTWSVSERGGRSWAVLGRVRERRAHPPLTRGWAATFPGCPDAPQGGEVSKAPGCVCPTGRLRATGLACTPKSSSRAISPRPDMRHMQLHLPFNEVPEKMNFF